MAVTGIRRISRWTLYILTFVNLAILGLFFFGGVGEPYGVNAAKNPIFTGELLIWCYILLALCAFAMLAFGLTQFASKFVSDSKAALMTLSIFISLFALFIIAYTLGNGTLLSELELNPNSDAQTYNTVFWLKTTDMWLYSMYLLLALSACAIFWGSIKKILNK